jgi:hypothetical protein
MPLAPPVMRTCLPARPRIRPPETGEDTGECGFKETVDEEAAHAEGIEKSFNRKGRKETPRRTQSKTASL